MAKDIDMAMYDEIKQRCTDMEAEYATRNSDYDDYENMFLMEWDDLPNESGLKPTISPDAANSLLGALRLLTATDPIFSFQTDIEAKDKVEQMCVDMWKASGKVQRVPVHYDALLSALLYGEMVIAVNNTEDMVKYAKQAGLNLKRAERLAEQTPFYFEVWNPRNGYPEFDSFGLSAYYKKAAVRVGDIKTRFGNDAKGIWDEKDWREEVELSTYYDDKHYAVWCDNSPILLQEHGLPQIPISVTITEGSRLFEEPEYQRRPFLYTMAKSKLWERQNLALTVLYTKLFEIGINPLFTHTRPAGQEDKQLDVDMNAGIVHLDQGESFQPILNKGVLDPSLQESLSLADQKISESTIYRQTLGQPMRGTDTFSTVALLSQSGRLPLISPQKRGAWGIAEAMEIALNWYRENGSKHKNFDVKPSDIPARYELEVTLDVALPQDKLQQANIATMLQKAGLASNEWIREHMLNIGDNQEMTETVWGEQAAQAMFAMFLQQKQQEQAMKQQMMQQQAQMAQQQPPPPPQGMPPEMAAGAQMPPEGMPMQGGLPHAQAGMIPGQGQGMIPPEEGMM